jgi:transcriptional antiterminator RfaH
MGAGGATLPGMLPASLALLPELQTPWFAIYTRSRHEKIAAEQLERKHIPVFLPLRTELHRWNDRYQKVDVPMFRGYVFAQFERQSPERMAVLRTTGVARIIGFGQEDAPIPAEQIESLRRLVEQRATLHPHRYLRVGQRVKVLDGALVGVEGILVRIRNHDRLVIALDAIRQAVAFEVSGYAVTAV